MWGCGWVRVRHRCGGEAGVRVIGTGVGMRLGLGLGMGVGVRLGLGLGTGAEFAARLAEG